MSLLSIILFFIYTWGLGFSLGRLVRESENFLERSLMRVGIGFCAFIVLGIILNALRVPLDYRIFLVAAIACPLYCLIFRKGYKSIKAPSLKLRQSDIAVIVLLVIFAVTAFMYISGAFHYSYLEDDDPWSHARGIKFIAVEKTGFAPPTLQSQYIDPYPPSYDMFFAVLHQSASSLYWVVKFFNALVISLSIIFFYFFAKEFMGSRNKALFAAFALASVPAYLSHFIWAPAFAMVAFFPAMYAFEMVKYDKKWWIVAAVCFASILLVHPTQAAKLSVFVAIYLGIKLLSSFVTDRKSWLQQNISAIKAAILGTLLSLFWWGFKWRVFVSKSTAGFRGGQEAATTAIQQSPNVISKFFSVVTRALNPDSGTATRVYTFKDLAVATSQNMINNPVGLGLFVFLLMAAGLFSSVAGFAKFLPRPKVFLAVAAVAVIVFTIVITSSALDFQNGFYGRDGSLRPQNWANPPSYGGVFAISLVLVSIATVFILSVVALLSKKPDEQQRRRLVFLAILLGWLLFAFLGVNNKTFNLPIGLFAFRFWMVLAIPAALLAAEGLFAILGAVHFFKLDGKSASIVKLVVIAIVVAGVLFTSFKPKFDVNTSCWPSGAFWSGSFVREPDSGCPVPSELLVYESLRDLPPNTKVFSLSHPDQIIGFDKFACGWCEAEAGIRKRMETGAVSAREIRDVMKDNGYDYFVIGGIEVKNYGLNKTDALLQDIAVSQLFSLEQRGEAAFIFKVV